MRKIFNVAFSIMLLLSVFCLSGLGQTTGAITGTVSDSNGAVVPNATVVIKNVGSGQTFTATTNDGGTYRVPALGSGLYTVTVTATNFKKSVIENVKVDVGTPSTADIILEAGDVTATVVVTSGAEVLQTQTATVGSTITGRQITEIPITSRDALDIVTLLPGTAQVGRPRAATINGLPKGALNITIDGVDAALGADAVGALDRREAHHVDVDAKFGELHRSGEPRQPAANHQYTLLCHYSFLT